MFYLRNISPSLSLCISLFLSVHLHGHCNAITASNQLKGTLWEFSCK